MSEGRVKWFSVSKNFGFIIPSDGGAELFVHLHNLVDQDRLPHDGDSVEYDVGTNSRNNKREAKNVRIVVA